MSEEQENNDTLELYDAELEQEILGCLLIKNELFIQLELELTEDSFYYEQNKIIFRKIKELIHDNRVVDHENIVYELQGEIDLSKEEIKKIIDDIMTCGLGSIMTPKEIVKILNFLSLKRELVTYNKNVNAILKSNSINEIDKKISELEQNIYSITNKKQAKDTFHQLKKYNELLKDNLIKALKSDKVVLGVSTGFKDLDKYIGGLQKGDLVIIAARPSMGKTAFATTIAKNIATILRKEKKDGKCDGIAMFSLEMTGEQLAARIVSMDSGFTTKTIYTGRYDEKDIDNETIEENKKISEKEFNKISKSIQDLSDLPLYIDDTPSLDVSILRSRARFLKNKYNVCAIIIDYLQLLRASKNYNGNRVLEISEITSTLKAIAKELNIPVVALSQLSREVEKRDERQPQLSDLRESGTIEQDADIVMFLYREEYYLARKEPKSINSEEEIKKYEQWRELYDKVKNEAEVIIAKNRNGAIGKIKLMFDKERVLFSSMDKNYSNSQGIQQVENNQDDSENLQKEQIETDDDQDDSPPFEEG